MLRLSVQALLLLAISTYRIQQTISDAVACGADQPRVLSNNTGRFVSPNYPENYPDDANCTWLITSDEPNATLMLEFTVIRTEDILIDDVAVFDGNTSTNTELARFSGIYNISPDAIFSTGSQLFVEFYSSSAENEIGFEALYTSDTACRQPRDLSKFSGSFSSPYYPYTYTRNKTCEWILRLEPYQIANLRIESFNVSVSGQTCTTDYLEVTVANGTSRQFCGLLTPPSSLPIYQSATFKFVSHPTDTPAAGNGFYINYEIRNNNDATAITAFTATNQLNTTRPVKENTTEYFNTGSLPTDNSNVTTTADDISTTDNSNVTTSADDSSTTDNTNFTLSTDDTSTTDNTNITLSTDGTTYITVPTSADNASSSEFPIWAIVVISVVSALVVAGVVAFIVYKCYFKKSVVGPAGEDQ